MEQTKEKHDQYYEMAHAPVGRVISKLAVPTIISMLVTSIYNMLDTFFVSQLGTSASGAVGIIFSAMAIIQALSFMIGIGSGNYIARLIGAGNRELAEKLASIGFFTGFGMGLVITVLGTANIHALVMMLGSTVTIAPYAEAYASYILLATPVHDDILYHEQYPAFPGKGPVCHGRHYHRRYFKHYPGSGFYFRHGYGNGRSGAGYRNLAVCQLLHSACHVQSSQGLYFH